MEYEEVMKNVSNIYKCLENADENTKHAFLKILDGYEQWCHL